VTTKQEFEKELEAQLKEWDAKIELLEAQMLEAESNTRVEYEQQLGDVQAKRAEVEQQLRELKHRGESTWHDLRKGLEIAWGELGQAMDDATALFRKK
jgi:chromosome segregation ATPase